MSEQPGQPFQIEVINNQQSLAVEEEFVQRGVTATLHSENISSAGISVAIVDDPRIHELNRRFLDHDYPTDVLSFLLDASGSDDRRHIEGEVIVSADTARHRAREFNWRPLDELLLYVVHGTLHLCGYDDHESQERHLMRSRERSILGELGLEPLYSEDGEPPSPGSAGGLL